MEITTAMLFQAITVRRLGLATGYKGAEYIFAERKMVAMVSKACGVPVHRMTNDHIIPLVVVADAHIKRGTVDTEEDVSFRRLARKLYGHPAHELADPDLACKPVRVRGHGDGLVLSLDTEAINSGRTEDPIVLVFFYDAILCEHVAWPYSASSLAWRVDVDDYTLSHLRNLAGIANPNDATPRHRPFRHGI